jgi:hypothetical protein
MQLSFSACQKYLLSPMSWYLHYLLRVRPIQQGSALVFGSALDAGFNSLLQDKKDGVEVSLAKAKSEFNKVFGATNPKEIKYSKADYDTSSLPLDFFPESMIVGSSTDRDIPIEWHCLKFKGHIMIEEYAEQVLPRIQEVYEIQKEINLTNEVGDTFTGIIDLIAKIDDKILICDNKSSSITYAQDSVANSEQLASYYEAMKNDYKLDGACYIVVSKKLRKVKLPRVQIDMIFGSIDENLIAKTFEGYEQVLYGVKNGRFECTRDQRDGCCSAPWGCAYKTYCVSNGTDMTGLKIEEKR